MSHLPLQSASLQSGSLAPLAAPCLPSTPPMPRCCQGVHNPRTQPTPAPLPSPPQEAASGSGGFLQLPEVLVNLGHIHLSRQEYPDAIKLYSNASRWHHHRDAKILLYLARAHYDADDLVAARQALLRAIHLAPSDHRLRFNLGVTLQEHAVGGGLGLGLGEESGESWLLGPGDSCCAVDVDADAVRMQWVVGGVGVLVLCAYVPAGVMGPPLHSWRLSKYHSQRHSHRHSRHPPACPPQVRTFNKKRTPHDESKFDDFVRAGDELGCALQHFNYLKSKGHRHTALDMKKVNAHVSFCDSALNRVRVASACL